MKTEDPQDVEERAAIARLKCGEAAALEVLVRLHEVKAVRTAFGITGSRVAAEDVVADSFLAVLTRIQQFEDGRPFAPWFYRIVVNNALKQQRRPKAVSLDSIDLVPDLARASDPTEQAERSERARAVASALQQLPAEQRATVVLRYFHGLDEAAIGRVLGCARGTVKWRLFNARRLLAKMLGDLLTESPENAVPLRPSRARAVPEVGVRQSGGH